MDAKGFINQRRTAGAQKSSTLEIKAYLETQHPLTIESSESVQIYGLPMDDAWFFYGLSMDVYGLSMVPTNED